jgi:predicted ATPase
MTPSKPATRATSARRVATKPVIKEDLNKELVIVTGISGAGKASALRAFEDLGLPRRRQPAPGTIARIRRIGRQIR